MSTGVVDLLEDVAEVLGDGVGGERADLSNL
jgi:hypothetical protein